MLNIPIFFLLPLVFHLQGQDLLIMVSSEQVKFHRSLSYPSSVICLLVRRLFIHVCIYMNICTRIQMRTHTYTYSCPHTETVPHLYLVLLPFSVPFCVSRKSVVFQKWGNKTVNSIQDMTAHGYLVALFLIIFKFLIYLFVIVVEH